MTATIEGPLWAKQGLNQRSGRYPLSVEAPVMSMVEALVPGVSTQTRYSRYYAMYWAIAEHAERENLDAAGCRRVIRRSELLLALVSRHHDESDNPVGPPHGVDAINRHDPGDDEIWSLAATGPRSYSPRDSGFWSQYLGPSLALGTVTMDGGALRSGSRSCPAQVQEYFAPLLRLAAANADPILTSARLDDLAVLSLASAETPDAGPMRDLFTATRQGAHDPDSWSGDDATRRATFRIVARARLLQPGTESWHDSLMNAVAYGTALREDPILLGIPQAQAWRGVLLRRLSVGAWRRLWAALVAHVMTLGTSTRSELHEWISAELPDQPVASFFTDLAPVTDVNGDPAPAEDSWPDSRGLVAQIAKLVLGSQRTSDLPAVQRAAFLRGRATFLDPVWVARRVGDLQDQRLPELGRVFVDDMLAQARRVTLRKVRVEGDRLLLFTRLHERNGVYVAQSAEGFGNVGLRIDQLVDLGHQLGLFASDGAKVTPLGISVLAVA